MNKTSLTMFITHAVERGKSSANVQISTNRPLTTTCENF